MNVRLHPSATACWILVATALTARSCFESATVARRLSRGRRAASRGGHALSPTWNNACRRAMPSTALETVGLCHCGSPGGPASMRRLPGIPSRPHRCRVSRAGHVLLPRRLRAALLKTLASLDDRHRKVRPRAQARKEASSTLSTSTFPQSTRGNQSQQYTQGEERAGNMFIT